MFISFFKIFLIISVFLISDTSHSRDEDFFKFELGDKVSVLSDKAYRKSKEDIFEAIGNVVITQGDNALYGEKASMSLKTGDIQVFGNVRYVTPDLTLYGVKIDFNFKNSNLKIVNARIHSDTFVVLGKEISKVDKNIYLAKEAEFTTCKDCPESWSVYGKDIKVEVGQFITIQHAYIKIKGIVIMYIPYIVLPIKRGRETGLLFPKVAFDFGGRDGVFFQQPWYWAISDYSDLTLSPSTWTKRAFGSEFEYRKNLGPDKWIQVNSLGTSDKVYFPYRNETDKSSSGIKYFRQLTSYEHHFTTTESFNHHLQYQFTRDLDFIKDYRDFTDEKIDGAEIGAETFFEWRTSFSNLSTAGSFKRNQLIFNPNEFDNNFVQVLPRIDLETTPQVLYQSDYLFLKNISFIADFDYNFFKQNHVNESSYIRNAHRFNLEPQIKWNLGNFGPISLVSSAKWDYQHYRFPYQQGTNKFNSKTFTKYGTIYETSASISLEKIYGVSYQEEIKTTPEEKILEDKKISNELIGTLPEYKNAFNKTKSVVQTNSYRHIQDLKVSHFYLSDQQIKGNETFQTQIQLEQGEGLFDVVDTIREKETEIGNLTSQKEISKDNTVEFQWNHSIIRKSPKKFNPFVDEQYLRQHFDYSTIFRFNISQGYLLEADNEENFEDALTRLKIAAQLSFDTYNLSATEYYFYSKEDHLFDIKFEKNLGGGSLLGLRAEYASRSQFNQNIDFFVELRPIDLIGFRVEINYDYFKGRSKKGTYDLFVSPSNDCWKFNLKYEKTREDTQKDTEGKISFNFLINYTGQGFSALGS